MSTDIVMTRNADDDFAAQRIAQAALSEDASIISIAYNGTIVGYVDRISRSKFIVFIRAKDTEHMDRIDSAIDKALNS